GEHPTRAQRNAERPEVPRRSFAQPDWRPTAGGLGPPNYGELRGVASALDVQSSDKPGGVDARYLPNPFLDRSEVTSLSTRIRNASAPRIRPGQKPAGFQTHREDAIRDDADRGTLKQEQRAQQQPGTRQQDQGKRNFTDHESLVDACRSTPSGGSARGIECP